MSDLRDAVNNALDNRAHGRAEFAWRQIAAAVGREDELAGLLNDIDEQGRFDDFEYDQHQRHLLRCAHCRKVEDDLVRDFNAREKRKSVKR